MMNVTSHTKAGHRVMRRTTASHLRVTVHPAPVPSPRSFWQRLWAALWPVPTLEQLYARQQRHARMENHRPVMTLGGRLVLPPGTDLHRPAHPAQADLP